MFKSESSELFILSTVLLNNCYRSVLEFMHIYCKPYNMSIKYCFIKYPFGMKWWTSDQTYRIQIESRSSQSQVVKIQFRIDLSIVFHKSKHRSSIYSPSEAESKCSRFWNVGPLCFKLWVFNLQMNCC